MANSRSDYSPSILQDDITHCFLCGRCDRKLDRHEVFPASNRQKSKRYGLWVTLCHYPCHLGKDGLQYNADRAKGAKIFAQVQAMRTYGWTIDDFRKKFGKNYLEGEEE